MRGYIYLITSTRKDGKIYIGSSINYKTRWQRHKYELRNNKHPNPYLQNTYNAYGAEVLDFILAEVGDFVGRKSLSEREQVWIDLIKPDCYNLAPAGYPLSSVLCSAETRAKIGIKSRGRKWSVESRLRHGQLKRGLKPWLGRKHSEESIEKMRKSQQKANARRKKNSQAMYDLPEGGSQAGLAGQSLDSGGMEAGSLP